MLGATKESALTIAKFRGCLVGALLGDCLGAPFEGDSTVSKVVLQNYFDKLETPKTKNPIRQFTDDTVMSKAIAESLVEYRGLNEEDIAKRFVGDWLKEPRRGYGQNVVDIFSELRRSRYADIWAPARAQFDGSGSFGNGGAMRIAPVALFCPNDPAKMIEIATKCTQLTHTHRLGVNGALLQCLAVNMSLKLNPVQPLDSQSFLNELIDLMVDIEKNSMLEGDQPSPYKKQLKFIKDLLAREPAEFPEEIVATLGHSVAALWSVPTAIYCFLRGQTPVPYINSNNVFRRVLQLSISLGGDTDTIASMAGAMAGAHLGLDHISPVLQSHCEGLSDVTRLSDQLHHLGTS